MDDNEQLMRRAEGLAGLRRVALIINGLAYFVWIGATGLEHGHVAMDAAALKLAQMAGGGVWLVSLLILFWIMARLGKNREIGRLVDDERTQGLSARCYQMGYWALLLGVTGVYTASFLTKVDVNLVAPLLLATGVAVPPLTFAFLYRG